jgi:threonyl-tRNA synthetase
MLLPQRMERSNSMDTEQLNFFESEEHKRTYWHTCSHILAHAMKRLHPDVKLAIGPSIENGFYYDFDSPDTFTPEQLTGLEAEMQKIPYMIIVGDKEKEKKGVSVRSYARGDLGISGVKEFIDKVLKEISSKK